MQVFSKHIPDQAQGSQAKAPAYHESEAPGPRVLPIKVDRNGRERIGFVKKEVYSSYVLFHKDPRFIQALPDFNLPMLGTGSFRAFEIADDAMTPLQAGTIVVGEYLQDWAKLSAGKTYVIVHQQMGILYRRVYPTQHIADLKLVAEKETLPNLYLELDRVCEIWEARMFMSV